MRYTFGFEIHYRRKNILYISTSICTRNETLDVEKFWKQYRRCLALFELSNTKISKYQKKHEQDEFCEELRSLEVLLTKNSTWYMFNTTYSRVWMNRILTKWYKKKKRTKLENSRNNYRKKEISASTNLEKNVG